MAEDDYCCRKRFVHFSGGQVKAGETQPGIVPRLCTEWSFRQGPEKKTEINCSPQNAMPQFNLIVSQSTQTAGDGGHAFGEHGSLGDYQRVGFQFVFVFLDVVPKADNG